MRTLISRATGMLIAASLLAGCASVPNYSAAIAASLQERVLAVTEDAANGEFESALKHLDVVVSRADEALASGEISADRHSRIVDSVALVRADIEAAIQLATDKDNDEGTSTDKPGKGKDSGDRPGKGNKDD